MSLKTLDRKVQGFESLSLRPSTKPTNHGRSRRSKLTSERPALCPKCPTAPTTTPKRVPSFFWVGPRSLMKYRLGGALATSVLRCGQPQGDVLRLHCLLDHVEQPLPQMREIHLAAQRLGEGL